MKVYGYPGSYSCSKVFWALHELAVPFEYVLVDVVAGEQKQPAYTRMNPNQGIPVLDDDGFTLYESGAILHYLEATRGKGKLLPDDPRQRALVDQWLFWDNSQIGPLMVKPWLMKFAQGLGAPFDQAVHAAQVESTRKPLRILDEHLAGRSFVVGDRLSLADIALGESVYMHAFSDVPVGDFANVRSWLAGLSARPAFQSSRGVGQKSPA